MVANTKGVSQRGQMCCIHIAVTMQEIFLQLMLLTDCRIWADQAKRSGAKGLF